jgi:hypothetical protein
MNLNKLNTIAFILLILVGSLYRVILPPYGYAPQIAMTIFGGLMIQNRKWAFALPVLSLFISDLLYQALYTNGMTNIRGFYTGMIQNYLLLASLTIFPLLLSKQTFKNVAGLSLLSPTVYFLVSNFMVWVGGGGYAHPKTFTGMMQTYSDALPFYYNSLIATAGFNILLFGAFFLTRKLFVKTTLA